MKTEAQMRKYVMRRVYLMYCTRAVCKPVPRAAIFAILLFGIVGSVSIANVIGNAASITEFSAFMRFIVAAFTNTSLTVQVLSIALAAWVAWFVVDTAQNVQLFIEHKEVA